MMNFPLKKLHQLLLISVSSAMLLACTAEHDDQLSATGTATDTYAPGVPGGVTTNVITLDATVKSINLKKRSVTLEDAQGNKRTIKLSEDATNLDQVKVGDNVQVQVAEEMAVFMRDKSESPTDATGALLITTPQGKKPGFLAAETQEITATVTAVDIAKHTATLQFEDGSSRTIPVRPDIKLSNAAVGHQMVIQVTQAVALSVTPK